MLNLRAPWWLSPFVGSDAIVFTQMLEWSIHYCLLDYLFLDNSFTLSSVFLKDVEGLRWRFITVGVIQFALLPFVLVFMIIHFFLQNAQTFHSSKAYLGPRRWSPLALWTFREFNELPHVFEERVSRSIKPTMEYLALFHNAYLTLLAKCIAYIAGAIVAVLIAVSFLNEDILLHVEALEHNLLWYLGLFTAIYAAASSVIPDEIVQQNARVNAEELLNAVGAHTHYFPEEWRGRCHTENVFTEVSDMFPYKLHIFVMELYSVIITPIILCFSLPETVDFVIDFVRYVSRLI